MAIITRLKADAGKEPTTVRPTKTTRVIFESPIFLNTLLSVMFLIYTTTRVYSKFHSMVHVKMLLDKSTYATTIVFTLIILNQF